MDAFPLSWTFPAKDLVLFAPMRTVESHLYVDAGFSNYANLESQLLA